MKLQTVHLRVNDAVTGQAMPAELSITDFSGNSFAPFGQHIEFSTQRGEDVGGRHKNSSGVWFTFPGQCEIALPPVELRVRIRKGIDYAPVDQVVALGAGKMALRFTMARKSPTDGVQQVDARCHFSTPHAALLDGAAAGLDVVNLQAMPISYLAKDGNTYTSVTNLAAWSGQDSCVERWGTHICVNTHHAHPVLGSLGLLHTHRPVFPLTSGHDGEPDWTLEDWVDQGHRKGGLAIWCEAFKPAKPYIGETLALAVLGEVDAIELTPDNLMYAPKMWYRLLDAGVTLPLVGSSARQANDRPLGALRTLVATEAGEHWVSAIKRGSAAVTNGPRVYCHVDANRVTTSATSLSPFARLEVIANGKLVRTSEPTGHDGVFSATVEHHIDEPAWVASRVVQVDAGCALFAHSSAKLVGEPKRSPEAVAFVRHELAKLRTWISDFASFHGNRTREHLLGTIARAESKLAEPEA